MTFENVSTGISPTTFWQLPCHAHRPSTIIEAVVFLHYYLASWKVCLVDTILQAQSSARRSFSAREHLEFHTLFKFVGKMPFFIGHVSKESKNCARQRTKHVSNAHTTCRENATITCDVRTGTSFSSKERSSTSKRKPTMLHVFDACTTPDGTLPNLDGCTAATPENDEKEICLLYLSRRSTKIILVRFKCLTRLHIAAAASLSFDYDRLTSQNWLDGAPVCRIAMDRPTAPGRPP